MPEPTTPVKDGRRQRSLKSRDRIVTAMLDLVAAGRITPSADEVAQRAQVGLRTVFRHFADMESLYAALIHTIAEQYEMWLIPFDSSDWREQLAEIVDRRTATYERLLPFKRAGDAHRHMSPVLQAHYAKMLGVMRQRLHALLPATVTADALRFETIDLMLSFDVWQRLRDEQHLTSDQARAIVSREVDRLAAAGR